MSELSIRPLAVIPDRVKQASLKIQRASSVVYDVDFDFFCFSEHGSTGKPREKKIRRDVFDHFLELHDPSLFQPVVGHDESLQVWLDQGVTGATCVHFDYHHDCYISPESVHAFSGSRLDGVISIANYLGFAKKCFSYFASY